MNPSAVLTSAPLRHTRLPASWLPGALLLLVSSTAPAQLPWKDKAPTEGVPGLTATLKQPESDVVKAVQQVAEDSVIHGTWVYERDKTLTGAHPVSESTILHGLQGAGKAFYKVADRVVAPRFFDGSADIGSITVRYLVTDAGHATTRLQIDALFTEYGRKKAHLSTGVVEAAEYHAIESQLKSIQAAEAQRSTEQSQVSSSSELPAVEIAAEPPGVPHPKDDDAMPATEVAVPQTAVLAQLQQQVDDLKRKVEMRVNPSGAPLKSAPFNSAATLASVSGSAEVLILIVTPHWYGIETETGQHGWVHSSQLEPLP